MSQDLTLRIGEVRIDADPGRTDPDAVRKALEAALAELARRLQARLTEGQLESLALADIAVRHEDARRFLASGDFHRLVDTLAAEIEGRIGDAR